MPSDKTVCDLSQPDWAKRKANMDEVMEAEAAEKLKNLPNYRRPAQLKAETVLHPHQKEACRWLTQMERSPPTNPYYAERIQAGGGSVFFDLLSGRMIPGPYPRIKGGLLGDGTYIKYK